MRFTIAKPRCWRWQWATAHEALQSARKRISPRRRNSPMCACWREPPLRPAMPAARRKLTEWMLQHRDSAMPSRKTFSASRGAVRVCAVNRILLALRSGTCRAGCRASGAGACDQHQLPADRCCRAAKDRWHCAGTWPSTTSSGTVFIDQDYDGVVTWQEVLDARARYIEPAVLAQIAVARGGAACTLRCQGSRAGRARRARTICRSR